MKFSINSKMAVISLVFGVGMLAVILPQLSSEQYCLQKKSSTLNEPCALAEQQNWIGWIKGKSRSTQFHFVDLLELLNRLSPANSKVNG